MVFLQGVQQSRSKTEVAFHEFALFFRTVDASEIEDEVAVTTISIKLFRGAVDIIFIDGINLKIAIATSLAFLYII